TDGRILLTGGVHADHLLASAEILDPGMRTSRLTKGAMHTARYRHAAARLPSGHVLVAGGIALDKDHPYDAPPVSHAEIFDPETESFTEIEAAAPIPNDARATVLP